LPEIRYAREKKVFSRGEEKGKGGNHHGEGRKTLRPLTNPDAKMGDFEMRSAARSFKLSLGGKRKNNNTDYEEK